MCDAGYDEVHAPGRREDAFHFTHELTQMLDVLEHVKSDGEIESPVWIVLVDQAALRNCHPD